MADDRYQKGKKPDYVVGMLDKKTGNKANIGAAWKNLDGSIGIRFNAFVRFPEDSTDISLSCFPSDNRSDVRQPAVKQFTSGYRPSGELRSVDDFGGEQPPY